MNMRMSVLEIESMVLDLEQDGYSKQEALHLIQVAALSKISACIDTNYSNQSFFRINGSFATYEQ